MEYICNICNKNYSSYQSLWIHNKKYHVKKIINKHKQTHITTEKQSSAFECKFCNKILSRQDSLKRHEKNCKIKVEADKKQSEIENKHSALQCHVGLCPENIIITNLTNEIERLKADFKIILNGSCQLAQSNETIVQTNQTIQNKKSIPIAVKRLVWNKYIGEDIGKSKCYCCKLSSITQLTFHCGHVVAEKNGGDINVDNLRPICQSCNSSMGTINMDDYIYKYSLHKSNNIEL